MSLERGRRASSVDRALDEWRKDAQRWRTTAFGHRQALGTAHTLVAKAIERLNDGDPMDALLHLIDALPFLITDDNTQKGTTR